MFVSHSRVQYKGNKCNLQYQNFALQHCQVKSKYYTFYKSVLRKKLYHHHYISFNKVSLLSTEGCNIDYTFY
jgi:hypothetical protein